MMVANMANGVAGAPTPPTLVSQTSRHKQSPSIQSPQALSALQPSPTDRIHTSSTSPTNTSGSDGSAVGLDFSALLAAAQQAKADFTVVKQDPPIQNPLFSMPDASAILQFFQSQQAAMLQAAAQRAAVVQQAQQAQQVVQQHQQQQSQPTERKRSYPCTFQFCVLCQKDVHSSKLPCHIRQCHVAKPMFQCPACDFTSTYSKNNVKSHMVSLHGLAGDPISYMDRYAPQVEEFMKMCFPNVRGRGRPMQGRGSPRSPSSPQNIAQRRQSQTSSLPRRPSFVRDSELLALAAQQQQQQHQQAALFAAQAQSLNQLSIFPQLFNNNTVSTINQNSGMKTPIMKTEAMEESAAVVSSASSLDEMLQSIQTNSTGSSRQMSITSTGSLRHLSQTVRPGENWQPRYNHIPISWMILNGEQVKDTIFNGLPDVLEKIELPNLAMGRKEESFLKEVQQAKIKAVREALQIQTFEILFAIHRIDHTILKTSENVDRLISVAPSAIDAQKIRDYQEMNPSVQLNEDEQFLATLAQVKHLEEKLCIMRHMSRFDQDLTVIFEQLQLLSQTVKSLSTSETFKSLVQLVLAAQNSLLSTTNTCPVRGFIVSQMEDICQFKLPSEQTLLSLIAALIKEKYSEIASAFDLITLLENASKTPFVSILAGIAHLEENNTRADCELKETSNDLVAAFLENSQSRLNPVNEMALNVKDELMSLLAFMAEPLPRPSDIFTPESFFRRVASFLRSVRDLVEQVDV